MLMLLAEGTIQLALAASQHGTVFLVGAGLIGYRAACFAGALAGSLAFAAAAMNQGLLQAVALNGCDMLHGNPPPSTCTWDTKYYTLILQLLQSFCRKIR